MVIVLLKFAENKRNASQFMDGHNLWIKQGFDDGVFLLVGSLQPGLGGSIIADGESKNALQVRVDQDPFVEQGVVTAELLEIDPKKAAPELQFLIK